MCTNATMKIPGSNTQQMEISRVKTPSKQKKSQGQVPSIKMLQEKPYDYLNQCTNVML